MDRHAATEVLRDMRSGLRVLVLSETRLLARCAFEAVAAEVGSSERAFRAYGNERIIPGAGNGWVRFHGVRSGTPRGISADVAVFDEVRPDQAMLDAVRANLATSPVGKIVRPDDARREQR
jgi:hypothetical protein